MIREEFARFLEKLRTADENGEDTVRFYNQEKLLYFEPLAITVIEVNKFFGHADVFASDRSRLAQWLRAIDTLNREADFGEFVTDPVFKVLQEDVK